MLAILRTLSAEEQEEFDCDVMNINWPVYMQNYGKGMQVYALFQDQVAAHHNMRQILMKNKVLWDDFRASFVGKTNIVSHKPVDTLKIINEKRFNDYIRMRMLEKSNINSLPEDKKYELLLKANYRYDQAKVTSELSRMSRSINKKAA